MKQYILILTLLFSAAAFGQVTFTQYSNCFAQENIIVINDTSYLKSRVSWTGLVNMTVEQNGVVKTAGSEFTEDARAVSVETFEEGDYVQFRIARDGGADFIATAGFSLATVSSVCDIKSGLYYRDDGPRFFYAWLPNCQSSTNLVINGSPTTWAHNEWYRIVWYNGTNTRYYKSTDGITWQPMTTSGVFSNQLNGTYHFGVSFQNPGTRIYDFYKFKRIVR